MLGGVGGRLLAGPRQLLHGARSLRQQIEQLESHGAREALAHQRDRLEQRSLRCTAIHPCNSIDHLIACQVSSNRSWGSRMFFRQLLNDQTACASYLLGCATYSQFAVIDPHVDLVDDYIALAETQGIPIAAVFDTHVQADHVSGLPDLVALTGATPYLPAEAGVDFDHHPLADGEIVKLGNTEIQAIAK